MSTFSYYCGMHKQIAILLSCVLYFFMSIGVFVDVHKCCGKIVSVDWYEYKSEKCGSNGCEKKGCCENTSEYFRVKDDQDYTLVEIKCADTPIFENFSCYSFIDSPVILARSKDFFLPQPDRPPKIPIHLKNRVLLI